MNKIAFIDIFGWSRWRYEFWTQNWVIFMRRQLSEWKEMLKNRERAPKSEWNNSKHKAHDCVAWTTENEWIVCCCCTALSMPWRVYVYVFLLYCWAPVFGTITSVSRTVYAQCSQAMCKYSKQKLSKRLRAVNGQMGNTVWIVCDIAWWLWGTQKFHIYTQLKNTNAWNCETTTVTATTMTTTTTTTAAVAPATPVEAMWKCKTQNTVCGHRQSTVVFANSTRTVVCHSALLKNHFKTLKIKR